MAQQHYLLVAIIIPKNNNKPIANQFYAI